MELLFSIYNKATFERQILSGIYHLKSLQIVFQLKSVKVKREKAFNNTPWQVYEQKKKKCEQWKALMTEARESRSWYGRDPIPGPISALSGFISRAPETHAVALSRILSPSVHFLMSPKAGNVQYIYYIYTIVGKPCSHDRMSDSMAPPAASWR